MNLPYRKGSTVWPFSRGDSIGRRGEKLAARTLKAAGCRVLVRNYRCPAGEADLIALIGDTLVFAEVKTRTSDYFTDPESAVDRDKRARYRKVARYYVRRTRRPDLNIRYDIVAIVLTAGAKPDIRHIENAF